MQRYRLGTFNNDHKLDPFRDFFKKRVWSLLTAVFSYIDA